MDNMLRTGKQSSRNKIAAKSEEITNIVGLLKITASASCEIPQWSYRAGTEMKKALTAFSEVQEINKENAEKSIKISRSC